MDKRVLVVLFVSVTLIAPYLGSYFLLRRAHVIVHYSNAAHSHPEERSPGHLVDTASDHKASDRIVKTLFGGAMRVEEAFHSMME